MIADERSPDEYGHVPAVCSDECNGCGLCLGGLYACTVCGGLEGAMPSVCPGRKMTGAEVDEVYDGKIDFRPEKVTGCSVFSPARWRMPFQLVADGNRSTFQTLDAAVRYSAEAGDKTYRLCDAEGRQVGEVRDGKILEARKS